MGVRGRWIFIVTAASLAAAEAAGIGTLAGAWAQSIHRDAAPDAGVSAPAVDQTRRAYNDAGSALARAPAPAASPRFYAMPFYSFAGRFAAAGRG